MSTPTTPDRCLIWHEGMSRPVLVLAPTQRSLGEDSAVEAWYRAATEAIAWARTNRVVLDLGQIEHLAGFGLSKVVRLYRDLAQAQGRLALCHVVPPLAEVVKVTRLDRLLPVYADLPAAVAAIVGA
jgi:anti-anti-sigma factor